MHLCYKKYSSWQFSDSFRDRTSKGQIWIKYILTVMTKKRFGIASSSNSNLKIIIIWLHPYKRMLWMLDFLIFFQSCPSNIPENGVKCQCTMSVQGNNVKHIFHTIFYLPTFSSNFTLFECFQNLTDIIRSRLLWKFFTIFLNTIWVQSIFSSVLLMFSLLLPTGPKNLNWENS